MRVKLTLSLSKEAVKKAKRISAQTGKSVSRMVEEYFDSLNDEPARNAFTEIKRLMEPYRERILNSLPKDKSFKEIINDWRDEDFQREMGTQSTRPKRRKNEKTLR